MTDAERLDAMRVAAETIMTAAGIREDRMVFEREQDRRLTIFWEHGWTTSVRAPIEMMGHHYSATLQHVGHVTPCCFAVLNVLDQLMWKDRER